MLQLKCGELLCPRRNEIKCVTENEYFSVQEYKSLAPFHQFSLEILFKKWAAVEVAEISEIPQKMSFLTIIGDVFAICS